MENETNETQNMFSKDRLKYFLELNINLENPCQIKEITDITKELNEQINNKFYELRTELFLRRPKIYASFMAIGYKLNCVHLGQLPEPYNEIPFIKENLKTIQGLENILIGAELLKYPNQFVIDQEYLNEILTDLRKQYIKFKEIEKEVHEYNEEYFNKVEGLNVWTNHKRQRKQENT